MAEAEAPMVCPRRTSAYGDSVKCTAPGAQGFDRAESATDSRRRWSLKGCSSQSQKGEAKLAEEQAVVAPLEN